MANTPRCLFCNTPRPADVGRCPECGNRWIDSTIAEAVAPVQAAPSPTVADVRPVDVVARAQSRRRRRWVFPLAITLAAVAIYAIVFAVLIQRSGPDDPVSGGTTTTTTAGPDDSTTTSAPTTTEDPGTGSTTTTTAGTTTTSTTSTAPPPTTTTLPPIEPVGRPISTEDLTLGAFALGPLTIGDDEIDALGRLAATFGQPDAVREIGEADGLCPTETGREVRFGWLTVIVRDSGGAEELAAYRLEEPADGPSDHPTASLGTISGAAIGDTVDEWRSIYRTSIIRVEDIAGEPTLLLLRSSDERTLLWGPVDDSDPQRVVGIFSPEPCLGGPFSGQ